MLVHPVWRLFPPFVTYKPLSVFGKVHRTQRTRNKRKSCASTNSSNQTGIATLPRAYHRPRPSIRAYSSIIRRLLPTKPRLINKIHRILRNLVFVGALHATSIISIQMSIATSPPASHAKNQWTIACYPQTNAKSTKYITYAALLLGASTKLQHISD